MADIKIRTPVSAAIAWTIIAEVIRQHGGDGDLRVVEAHPSGGQSHLLSIFRTGNENGSAYDSSSVKIGDFNLLSGRMRGHLPESDEDVEWLRIWLEKPDADLVVDVAVQTLGLPVAVTAPPMIRRIFGPCLLAALLGARLLHHDYLHAHMAYEDTSGHSGGVRQELQQFSALVSHERIEAAIAEAADCWLLFAGWQSALVGAVRMDGWISSAAAPDQAHDLFAALRDSGSMEMTLIEAKRILRV